MLFPKFPLKNFMDFSSSLPLFCHFTHLPKLAFHPTSCLTTLLKTGAVKSITYVQHSPFHKPWAVPHPAPQKQILASWNCFRHCHTQFKKRDQRQRMLLHAATNCSPITACREVLTLEQLLKSRVSRCQDLLLYHCQSLPRTLEA